VGIPDISDWSLQVQQAVDWALDNKELLALLISALALFRPWGFVGGLVRFIQTRRVNAPQIAFGFERIDELLGDESSFVLSITNVGRSAVKKVRTEWHAESTCDLRPPAQPFTLLPGATQSCEFVVRPIDAILRINRPAAERRLGSLIVTYEGSWRRRRTGASLIMAESASGHVQNAIDLSPLPRKRLRDVVPIIGRWVDLRAARRRAQRAAEGIEQARTYLAEHDVHVQQKDQDDDVFRRLLGELQRRGWAWDHESSGSGYTVKAEKSWPPSSSQTIRAFADTREDAAMIVLAGAIRYEAERTCNNCDPLAA
jgi:hypothetical protein